jgi:hypothetical protein
VEAAGRSDGEGEGKKREVSKEGSTMRNISKVVIGVLFLLLSVQFCFAYDEPDNFAGVKFKEDLRLQLVECPYLDVDGAYKKFPDYLKIKSLGKPCYSAGSLKDTYVLSNMGEIQKYVFDISARQIDDRLEEIHMNFSSVGALRILAILNQRYGAPTEKSVEPWQSRGGVKTTSIRAIWKGEKVSILFREHNTRIEWGLLSYETDVSIADNRNRMEEAIKKSAGGL